jgi:two-component system LytT family sensor kinase
MHTFFQRTGRILGSRLARNIYFWVVLFAIKREDIDDQHVYSDTFYYTVMIGLLLFFVALTSINNLLLVPRLLARKKWYFYVPASLAFTFIMAFAYTALLKFLEVTFPGISTPDLSIIMDPVTKDLSFRTILDEMQTYFFFMVILQLIFTLLWFSNESVRRNRELMEVISRHREAELHFLKNQVNPHFLFNTLNNLYSLSLKKAEETPETILKLSSIMRYMLYESDTEKVSFDKEKEVMQAYIDIELLRLTDSPEIRFSIMADKPYSIPPLLWLPVLENIFKHGRSQESLEIDFRFSIRDNRLQIYSRNNKRPAPATAPKAGGIGLGNLRKRLELLFPQKHMITVTDNDLHFIIAIDIILD